MSKRSRQRKCQEKSRQSKSRAEHLLPTLAQVCEAPDAFLVRLDVAALNLMCALGLPGAEHLNVSRIFTWLDDTARKVDLETRRHWYRFLASPETYNGSPGYFCCYFLLQVLQEDCGVKYNPLRAVDRTWQDHRLQPDFRDSRDLFIHGIIDGSGGTCASMPILYLAVGRRLGYPLKLVETRGHLFIRWDDPLGLKRGIPERFNIEGAGSGISSFPDEYYQTWPEVWTTAEKKANCYLRSLTPAEELAAFLMTRGACLEDNRRFDQAIQAYRWACGLAPNDDRYRGTLNRLIWRSQRQIMEIEEVMAMGRQSRGFSSRYPVIPQPPHPVPSLHGEHCKCWNCEQVRQSRSPGGYPGHHPQCACLQCQKIRRPATQAQGHMSGCMCFQCRQLGQAAGHHTPGHPQGCRCVHCQRSGHFL